MITAPEPIRKSQIIIISTLLSQLKIEDLKDDLVYQYTDMRTTHRSQMTVEEASGLIQKLRRDLEDKVSPMRNKIVYYLCMFGMKTAQDKPDYPRINAYIKNIGSRNPKQKPLYELLPDEVLPVLNQVEAMVKRDSRKQNH